MRLLKYNERQNCKLKSYVDLKRLVILAKREVTYTNK